MILIHFYDNFSVEMTYPCVSLGLGFRAYDSYSFLRRILNPFLGTDIMRLKSHSMSFSNETDVRGGHFTEGLDNGQLVIKKWYKFG